MAAAASRHPLPDPYAFTDIFLLKQLNAAKSYSYFPGQKIPYSWSYSTKILVTYQYQTISILILKDGIKQLHNWGLLSPPNPLTTNLPESHSNGPGPPLLSNLCESSRFTKLVPGIYLSAPEISPGDEAHKLLQYVLSPSQLCATYTVFFFICCCYCTQYYLFTEIVLLCLESWYSISRHPTRVMYKICSTTDASGTRMISQDGPLLILSVSFPSTCQLQ